MHGIDAQIAGPALGIWAPTLANRDPRGPGLRIVHAALPVATALAQVVDVGDGDQSQPLDIRLPYS